MNTADTMRAAVEALPQQIINLPCRVPYIGHPDAVRQWREGHRAARHAAADLVSYALSLLRSALADDALRIAGAAGPLGDPDVLASPLPDKVLQLLNHIEDVVGDEAWGRIDAKLWNAVTKLAAGVAPTAPAVPAELDEVLQFLYGAGPMDGVWFGSVPAGKPRYWWRSYLRDAVKRAFGVMASDGSQQ